MSFTAPYKQHHYMGEHSNDASALTFIQTAKWDTLGNGTGNPRAGMIYYNTTSQSLKLWNGSSWIDAGGVVDSVFGRTGAVTAQSGDYEDGQITAAGSATNYTPSSATVEGHLAGIDTAIGLKAADADVIKKDGSVAFTGNQSIGGNKLTNVGAPTAANDAATKTYVDNLITGLQWRSPIATINLIGNRTVAEINGLSPNAGDAYVVTDAGTLTSGSLGVVAGDLVEFSSGGSWVKLASGSGGFVAEGVRAVLSNTVALVAPYTDGVDNGKLLEFDGASNTGADTGEAVDGSAVIVNAESGENENSGYVFDGTVPSGDWVQFTGAGQVNAGDGLGKDGNTINVGAGNGIAVAANSVAVQSDSTGGANLARSVNVSANGVAVKIDDSTIGEGASNRLEVKDDGITNAKVLDGELTEAKLAFDACAVLTGADNPNAGTGTAGNIGDKFVDTTNDIVYHNIDGTVTGWVVS